MYAITNAAHSRSCAGCTAHYDAAVADAIASGLGNGWAATLDGPDTHWVAVTKATPLTTAETAVLGLLN